MIFQFRMLSDENDDFVRDYEVRGDQTLLDFHNIILESLEYEACMASFFTAGEQWERLREFTLLDMGDGSSQTPLPMERITLDELVRSENQRFIYLFDLLGDRAYYLELIGLDKPQEGALYPREVFARGEVPDQWEPGLLESDDRSIFDEAMDEFDTFGGDDNFDDEF